MEELDSFNKEVQRVETESEHELLDEEEFTNSLVTSLQRFHRLIDQNEFLNKSEKCQLLDEIDHRTANLFSKTLRKLKLCETSESKIRLGFLREHGKHLYNELLSRLEVTMKGFSQGFLGITTEELSALLQFSYDIENLYDFSIERYETFDALKEPLCSFLPQNKVVFMYTLKSGETLGIQQESNNRFLVFSVGEPVSFSIADIENMTEDDLESRLQEARTFHDHNISKEKAITANIEKAFEGKKDGFSKIQSDTSQFSDNEWQAVECAYNMGLDGALDVKMQLLVLKLFEKKQLTPPDGFVLDGDFGKSSQAALEILFREYNLSVSDDTYENFSQLIELYKQEYDEDSVSMFLTPQEINDPRYTFQNKGVFRALKMQKIKQSLIQNNFDIDSLQPSDLGGYAVFEDLKKLYPDILRVLDQLTDDKNLKASLIATILMETGLSGKADQWGIGRRDRKDYSEYLSREWPKLSAIWNEYGFKPVGQNSAGLMQINYKSAQDIFSHYLYAYVPKRMTIELLNNNPSLSILLGFLIYCKNFSKLEQLKKLVEKG